MKEVKNNESDMESALKVIELLEEKKVKEDFVQKSADF